MNIEITGCKLGKKTKTMKYYDKLEQKNFSTEEVEYAHADLQKAADGLVKHLAKAFRIDGEDRDYFIVEGFNLDTKDKHKTIIISGYMTNEYGYSVPVKSGHIPLDDTQDDLKVTIEAFGLELFKYFFEGKAAQGVIAGIPVNGAQEEEMNDKEESVDTSEDEDPEGISEEKDIKNFEGEQPKNDSFEEALKDSKKKK